MRSRRKVETNKWQRKNMNGFVRIRRNCAMWNGRLLTANILIAEKIK
jgi:hypothetical protein